MNVTLTELFSNPLIREGAISLAAVLFVFMLVHFAQSYAARTELSKISGESKVVWKNFVRRYRIEDAGLDPMVTMSFDSNWIEFALRYVVDYRVRRSTKDRLFTNILNAFEETDGKVQIASASLQLTEMPIVSHQLVAQQSE